MVNRVLIVDDQHSFREAFRRNLKIRGFVVNQAENMDFALENMAEELPNVLVTDLSMRTPHEGLDLIKAVRSQYPGVPIIMISAVGGFEDGALASQFGAFKVISKSLIDSEIEQFYEILESAVIKSDEYKEAAQKLAAIRESDQTPNEKLAALKEMINDQNLDDSIKGEAFELLTEISASEILQNAKKAKENVSAAGQLDSAMASLKNALPAWDTLDSETKDTFLTAEFLFLAKDESITEVDVSRNIGFSYCFAVENEVKIRFRKKLQRFLKQQETYDLIRSILDPKMRGLDLFFQQYMLRLGQKIKFTLPLDKIKETIQKLEQYKESYNPAGLQAIGVLITCFGRDIEVPLAAKKLQINNPLSIKGFQNDDETLEMAVGLMKLQYYRNPYIHPEFSEREQLVKIRDTAISCLKMLSQMV